MIPKILTEFSFGIGMVNTEKYRPIPTEKYLLGIQLYKFVIFVTNGGPLGPVDRDSLICDENRKHIKLHITTCFSTLSALATWISELAPQLSMLSPPLFVTVFIPRSSPAESSLVMA